MLATEGADDMLKYSVSYTIVNDAFHTQYFATLEEATLLYESIQTWDQPVTHLCIKMYENGLWILQRALVG